MRIWTRVGIAGQFIAHFVFDTENEAASAKAQISAKIGKKTGSIKRDDTRRLIVCGHGAYELYTLLGLEIPAELTAWRKTATFPRSIISDQEIVDDAREYETKTGWKRGSLRLYTEAIKRGLMPRCSSHMRALSGLYQVYAYEFEDMSVYVGLTRDPEARHTGHARMGPVSKKVGVGRRLVEIANDITSTEAASLERETALRYEKEGWKLLSPLERCGSFGNISIKYPYAEVLKLAQPFKMKTEFYRAYPPIALAVIHRGWIERLATDMNWPENAVIRWTFETCLQEAKKYKWKSDWARKSPGSYLASQRHGWFSAIKTLFKPKPRPASVWTHDRCAERARMFKSVSEWQYNAGDVSYQTARINGWLASIKAEYFPKRAARGTCGPHVNWHKCKLVAGRP